jgi:putative transposase
MVAAQQLAVDLPLAPCCTALGVSRASYDRRQQTRPTPPTSQARPTPPRALSSPERQAVLDTLHSERFVDRAPAEVYATLLDENTYLCSIRTMYRVLHQAQEVRERRNQLRHPRYQKPELLATAPNQVWSWDITKLLGPAKWTYFYLYVMLDVFSRYVVGWLLAQRESADLARRLIRESCDKQSLDPKQLTIHSDRGPSMRSQSVAQLLATLGVTKSHSRPHVSNDNPFSESQFKTLKYRPEFPDRFDSQEHGLGYCRTFFPWYNDEHHHWGLGLFTPAAVHFGQAPQLLAARQVTLTAAYRTHPERFVRREPKPLSLPVAVWINPPTTALKPQGNPLLRYTKFDRQVSQTH